MLPFIFCLFLAPGKSVLLITVDTARADAFSPYNPSGGWATPFVQEMADQGVVFERALTVAPLTLPAHTSILTGLYPFQHQLRVNGRGQLDDKTPNLAVQFQKAGYQTAAFVSSRVLDARFGLNRGFDYFDDVMLEDQVGEYGYPERTASVTLQRALAYMKSLKPDRPYFIWVHFYDPHAPYLSDRQDLRGRYQDEIGSVDYAVGKLMEASRTDQLTVLVADHGESLGEHGEEAHGLFVYQSVLHVPLIMMGPGLAKGTRIQETVSVVQIAKTILDWAKVKGSGLFQPAMPLRTKEKNALEVFYFESIMPLEAYGWSPLYGVYSDGYKWIQGTQAELYQPWLDSSETKPLNPSPHHKKFAEFLKEVPEYQRQTSAPETAESLSSLGYAQGSKAVGPLMDPRQGLKRLEQFRKAKALMNSGDFQAAKGILEPLVLENPGNLPFLQQLALVNQELGRAEQAIFQFEQAVKLSPELHFTHLNLAKAFHHFQHYEQAEKAYWDTLNRYPRAEEAWLGLAEIAHLQNDLKKEDQILRSALSQGVVSGRIQMALGSLALNLNKPEQAIPFIAEAVRLNPEHWLSWYLLGLAQRQIGQNQEALESLLRANQLQPDYGPLMQVIAKTYQDLGLPEMAAPYQKN
ncbi:MAG: sulfatase-like hydrolase/transferase [Acidobacteria bacterium]|nr:sulfatase-like hydrolase/transferase [Acidobacteriota bacterium]